MKKLSILLMLSLLVLTGCSDKNDQKLDKDSQKVDGLQEEVKKEDQEKKLTCRKIGAVATGVEMDSIYEVTYKGDFIQSIHTEEKIISDNQAVLNQYNTKILATYDRYKDLEYYEYSVNITGNTLLSVVDADYSKIDTKRMIEIEPDNAQLIKNGKIKVSDMKSVYQALGAVCD